jgi:transglutaminase-like putative cysteine protease
MITIAPPLEQPPTTSLRVRVGCDLGYESQYPTPMLLIVRPQAGHAHRLLDEQRVIEPPVAVESYRDMFGNEIWRLLAPVGTLRLRYDALADVPATGDATLPGLAKTPIMDLPPDVLIYTLPSRHCQSDLFIGDAWRMFGAIDSGWEQVQAVCDWIHANIEYGKGSTLNTSSAEVYEQRRGVCRDFAHLGVTFCRALNIPARYVCGYLPDINVTPDPTPMDFHAWFEVWLDGAWRTFDARHNRHRTGRTIIATGRDAVDVAFATIFGGSVLTHMQVWAEQVDPAFVLSRREES